jgi:hypothetical protein
VDDEEACQWICSGWRIIGEVFLTVIRGDDSRLCHGDVSAKGFKEAR